MIRLITILNRLNKQIIHTTLISNESKLLLPSILNSKFLLLNESLLNNQKQQIRGMKLWNEKLLRKMYWRKRSFDAEPEKLRPRSEWQDWDYASELFAFAHRIQEPQLLNDNILTCAFTHRSYLNEQKIKRKKLGVQNVEEHLEDNLELINMGEVFVKKFLCQYFRCYLQKVPEECIQSVIKYLMSTPVMSDISKWIGCIDLVLCSEFPPAEKTLADTVFSIVGAIIKTGGEGRARNFIIDFICTYLNGRDILEIWRIDQMDLNLENYLNNFDNNKNVKCEPRILRQSAIGTIESCYLVGIYSNQKLLGQSSGESLAIAKRMAELDAFRQIFGLRLSDIRFEYGTPEAYNKQFEKFDKENFHLFQSSDKELRRQSHKS